MPRQERTKSGTGIYHVMLRGINKQDIFEDDEDYSQFLNILHALVNRCDEQGHNLPPHCTFYAYCLMTNHVHLLVRERNEHIGESIKRVGVAYANSLDWQVSLTELYINYERGRIEQGRNDHRTVPWSPNYLKQIGNPTLRNINLKIRNTKLPGNNWRVNDPGHLHIY